MKAYAKKTIGTTVLALFIGLSISLLSTFSSTACAKTSQEIDSAVDVTLKRFYKEIDGAKEVASSAKALLVMPGVTKAGFVLGGAYGQGSLRIKNKTERYYNLIAGSYGFTIGAQQMDIILVFMTEKALEEFKSIDGWEIGVTGNVAIIDVGGGKRLDTTSLKDAVVAFVFEPKGLMVDVSLKGAKFTQIKEDIKK
jgi:lipid-binding SYLF domain-containing protein